MIKVNVETYSISKMGIEILLAHLNESGFIGLSVGHPLTKEDVISEIYHMSNSHILRFEDGQLMIEEPYKTIVDDIRNANVIMQVEAVAKKRKNKYFYFGQRFLACEASNTRKDTVQFFYQEKNAFVNLLAENEYLPEKSSPEEQELACEIGSMQELEPDSIVTKIKVFIHKMEYCDLVITREGLHDYFYIFENHTCKKYFYTHALFEKIMDEWMKGVIL
ncbi:MAG: hypothetical protein II073_00740 [Lachnospiraceae bacterium]|nr:hypothetical protein [Lachnospiraceae bacterium]